MDLHTTFSLGATVSSPEKGQSWPRPPHAPTNAVITQDSFPSDLHDYSQQRPVSSPPINQPDKLLWWPSFWEKEERRDCDIPPPQQSSWDNICQIWLL